MSVLLNVTPYSLVADRGAFIRRMHSRFSSSSPRSNLSPALKTRFTSAGDERRTSTFHFPAPGGTMSTHQNMANGLPGVFRTYSFLKYMDPTQASMDISFPMANATSTLGSSMPTQMSISRLVMRSYW